MFGLDLISIVIGIVLGVVFDEFFSKLFGRGKARAEKLLADMRARGE